MSYIFSYTSYLSSGIPIVSTLSTPGVTRSGGLSLSLLHPLSYYYNCYSIILLLTFNDPENYERTVLEFYIVSHLKGDLEYCEGSIIVSDLNGGVTDSPDTPLSVV